MRHKRTTSPHDAIFRQFLSRPEIARDFIQHYLPPALLENCDLSTLRREPDSFIADELSLYFCDILYSLRTSNGEGYIYVLIEHQSSPDRLMAFRMMRYAIAAMKKHLDTGHRTLPLVVPVLYYNGRESPYPGPLEWAEEFDDPALASELYNGIFPLVDVTVIPDEEMLQHGPLSALMLIQKHIRKQNLSEKLDTLIDALRDESTDEALFLSLTHYILQAGSADDAAAFVRRLAEHLPRHKEQLMTIAEQLEAIGHEKGFKAGREEGHFEALKEVAISLLRSGLSVEKVMSVTGFRKEYVLSLNV